MLESVRANVWSSLDCAIQFSASSCQNVAFFSCWPLLKGMHIRRLLEPDLRCGASTKPGAIQFDRDNTEESRNKVYVAINRARYSLCFLVEDKKAKGLPYIVWDGADSATSAIER